MRKLTALILSLAMALTLAACAPTWEDPPEDAGTPGAAEPADTGAPEQAGGTEPDKQEAAEPGAAPETPNPEPVQTSPAETPETEETAETPDPQPVQEAPQEQPAALDDGGGSPNSGAGSDAGQASGNQGGSGANGNTGSVNPSGGGQGSTTSGGIQPNAAGDYTTDSNEQPVSEEDKAATKAWVESFGGYIGPDGGIWLPNMQ